MIQDGLKIMLYLRFSYVVGLEWPTMEKEIIAMEG